MNRIEAATTNSIVVLIDQFTKAVVETITYDVLSKHVAVVTDIRELNDEHYKSSVVIFEPSFQVMVTPEILDELKQKLDIEVYAVYQDEAAVRALSSFVHAIKADYSEIGWNFIYAVVNNDLAILEPYQRSVKVLDGFSAVRSRIPEDIVEYIDRFRGSYMTLVSSVQDVLAKNAKLEETVAAQETIGRQTIAGIVELKELLDRSQDKVNAYELTLSKSYVQEFGGFYPERPRVLYIKRFSHLAGIDTLLSILFAVLTKQYMTSCKIVKLVDSSNALDLRYVPNTYVPVTDTYNTSQLLTTDFLVKLGGYNVMFDTLMLNRSGLDYLIVHDMRGVMGTALNSNLIDLRLNEMSADYAVLGEYDNVLSDSGKNVDYPWSFKESRKYTGTGVIKLTNHPTIGAILDSLI